MATPSRAGASLSALHGRAKQAGAGDSLEDVCRRAVELARKLVGAERGSVAWREKGHLRFLKPADARSPEVMLDRLPKGLLSSTMTNRVPTVVTDYKPNPAAHQVAGAEAVRSVVAVPMVLRDEVVGALCVSTYVKRDFQAAEVTLLEMLAAQIAPAVAARELAEERAEQASLFAALNELAVAVSGVLDIHELAELVADHAKALFSADSALVVTVDGPSGRLSALYDSDPILREIGLKPEEGAVGQAIATREPVCIDDYGAWEHGIRGGRTRSVLAVPIQVSDRPIGAVLVRSRSIAHFRADSQEALLLLAGQIGPALEAARLVAERARQTELLRSLHEIAVAAGGMLEPAALAALTITRAAEMLDVPTVGVHWWDAASGRLEVLARTEPAPFGVDVNQGASKLAFETGTSVLVNDYANWEGRIAQAVGEAGSILTVPLKVHDRVVGVLMAKSPDVGHFTDFDEQVLSLLAAEIAPSLEAARLHMQLSEALVTAESHGRQQAAVADLGRHALEGMPYPALAELVAAEVRAVLGVDLAAVVRAEDPELAPEVVHTLGCDGPVVCDELHAETRFDASRLVESGVRSSLMIKIRGMVRPAGVITAHSFTPRGFSPNEAVFIRTIANVLSEAIRREDTLAELAESQDRLQAVVENVPVILFTLDPDGTVLFSGGAGLARMGMKPGSNVGRNVRDLYADDPETLAVMGRALGGEVVKGTATHPGLELEFHYQPMRDAQGQLTGVIGLAMDVTERREAEVARRESAEKSRFLATMSHELRTPLNSVLGFAQLLQLAEFEPLTNRQLRYVGNIESSGRQLLELINDVLDLSKVAAGQLEVALERLEVVPILTELIARVQPLADSRGLTLQLDFEKGLVVRADRLRLTQIVNNLLSNALKFTEKGGITITAVQAEGKVQISVADTGIGIAGDDQVRVFDEFVQADPTLTRRRQGTGLGLALSRRLAHLMGGEVTLTSRSGEGSVFTITLPLGD